MRSACMVALAHVLCCAVGCGQPATKPLPPNAERLDSARAAAYKVEKDDVRIAENSRPNHDDRTVVAVLRRPMTRAQLRAIVRELASSAKTPNVDLYANESALEACGRNRYRVLRGETDPADSQACFDGTALRMEQAEPWAIYWGAAAPIGE